MSEGQQQYDNSNRGAGWPVDSEVAAKTLRIKADIGGAEYYGILIRTGAKSDKAPTHNLFLHQDRAKSAIVVAIFKNDKGGGHKIAGGELTLPNGVGYWVSLFQNKSEHPQSPVLDVSFQPKEVQPPPQDGYSAPAERQPPVVPEADNIPF